MARIEVTEESLRAATGERVFAQAVALAGKVAGLSAAGSLVEATVDGADVSVRVGFGGLDARCACPAEAPCSHAVAAVLAWVRAGNEEAGQEEAGPEDTGPEETAPDLRAELDDVIGQLAEEAGDCDPDDGWYPDTSDLEDLLDEVEDLADGAPDAARELAGHVAGRIRDVLAAGNCLTDDLADALARAEELHQGPSLPT
jgi:hypothetical protein